MTRKFPPELSSNICNKLKKNIPKYWDAKKSILEMKADNAKNWKQMEWIGWYFEYLCHKHLEDLMTMPDKQKYGNVSFDGFLKFPWDFKTHAIQSGNKIPVNDLEATSKAISNFGFMGLIIVLGDVKYDNDNSDFKKWHDQLKGPKSDNVKKNEARGARSRKRKTELKIFQILFLRVDNDLLDKCDTFQKNWRNANGNPRRTKVLLDLRKIEDHIEYVIDYSK